MIKITLGKLDDMWMPFKQLLTYQWPSQYAFDLIGVARKLGAERQKYEETRLQMVKRYGHEANGGFQIKQEHMDSYVKEINNLRDKEVEIDMQKIQMRDIINNAPVSGISPAILLDLEPIIYDETQKG